MNDSDFQGLSRAEAILENMLGATNNLKPPQSRVEALLIRLLELIEEISHGSGTVFRFIGEKEYVNDLPETGNEQGDVWFVKEKMAGYIWIVREDYPDGYWEELGEVIDTADSGSFTCIYGVTTWAEFAAAVQAGKNIKVRDGTDYGWADKIDLENGYASFTVIDGEDYSTKWCEFYPDRGWMNWTGGALANAYYVQTALATKQDLTAQVEITTDGAVTQALDPNKTYVLSGDLTSLTLALNAPISGVASIYQVFFKNGATAVNLIYPSTVTFADATFAPAANAWTELSIQYVYSTTEGGVTTPHYIAHASNIEEGVR